MIVLALSRLPHIAAAEQFILADACIKQIVKQAVPVTPGTKYWRFTPAEGCDAWEALEDLEDALGLMASELKLMVHLGCVLAVGELDVSEVFAAD